MNTKSPPFENKKISFVESDTKKSSMSDIHVLIYLFIYCTCTIFIVY